MTAKIIFSTQNGATNYFASVIQERLNNFGIPTDLHNVKKAGNQPEIATHSLLIFAAPTYDEGQLEPGMRQFVSDFNPDLSPYQIAVCGLGDSSFVHYCKAADILTTWVTHHHGHILVPALKIDGYPHRLAIIDGWVQQIIENLTP